MMKKVLCISLILFFIGTATANEFYVSNDGTDTSNSGTFEEPFKTIDYATKHIPNGGNLKVMEGTYNNFASYYGYNNEKENYLIIEPYEEGTVQFVLTNPADIIGNHVIIRGFTFTHENTSVAPILMQVRKEQTHDIIIQDNEFKDSYNNDLLKIHSKARKVKVIRNIFHNAGSNDEAIDINGGEDIQIISNLFSNNMQNDDSRRGTCNSFIVVKDSAGFYPKTGSHNILIAYNRFENFKCNRHHGFIRLGEDGRQFFEASRVKIWANTFRPKDTKEMAYYVNIAGSNGVKIVDNLIFTRNNSSRTVFGFDLYMENEVSQNVFIENNRFYILDQTELFLFWVEDLEELLNIEFNNNKIHHSLFSRVKARGLN